MFPKLTKKMRTRNFPLLVMMVIVITVGISIIQGPKAKPQAVMPKSICGDLLTEVITGAEADKILTEMHGMGLATTQFEIGYYGAKADNNILYLSIFSDEQTAKQDYMSMSMKMANGTAVFSPLSVVHKEDQVRFTTTGMGKMHFLYREKNILIWWQGDSTTMDAAIADLEQFSFSNR